MNKKVTFARFHSSLFIAALGQDNGDTLPPKGKTLDTLEMMTLGETGIEGGLLVTLGNKGVKKTIIIPAAMIKHVELAEELVKVDLSLARQAAKKASGE